MIVSLSNIILSLDEQNYSYHYMFSVRKNLYRFKFLTNKLAIEQGTIKLLLSSLLDKKIPITREKIGSECVFQHDPGSERYRPRKI